MKVAKLVTVRCQYRDRIGISPFVQFGAQNELHVGLYLPKDDLLARPSIVIGRGDIGNGVGELTNQWLCVVGRQQHGSELRSRPALAWARLAALTEEHIAGVHEERHGATYEINSSATVASRARGARDSAGDS